MQTEKLRLLPTPAEPAGPEATTAEDTEPNEGEEEEPVAEDQVVAEDVE